MELEGDIADGHRDQEEAVAGFWTELEAGGTVEEDKDLYFAADVVQDCEIVLVSVRRSNLRSLEGVPWRVML